MSEHHEFPGAGLSRGIQAAKNSMVVFQLKPPHKHYTSISDILNNEKMWQQHNPAGHSDLFIESYENI